MSHDHPCVECGAPLHWRGYVKRTRVGRHQVEDDSQTVPVCLHDHPELTIEDLAGYERRAAVVVLSEVAEIGGAEIRFGRLASVAGQLRLGLRNRRPQRPRRSASGCVGSSRHPPHVARPLFAHG